MSNPAEAWAPTELPIPVELTPDFHAEPFTPKPPTFFPPLAERLDEVMRQRLTDMYGSL